MPAIDQGVNLERYMFVPRTLMFLTRGDKILLLKGAENKRLWAGLYNGIGGHIEQGEDIITSAQRELLEETGLGSDNLWLCGIATVDTQINPGVCIFIFKGECPFGEPVPSNEGSLEWIEAAEIHTLPLVADLYVLLPQILKMRIGEPPFSSHSRYDEYGNISVTFGQSCDPLK
jgi:8-oxo-dGTP diphosphatase